jgi:hypothetical protein
VKGTSSSACLKPLSTSRSANTDETAAATMPRGATDARKTLSFQFNLDFNVEIALRAGGR